MVKIPSELMQAIQAGDCVLWTGAGLGALAGLPGWEEALSRAVARCPAEAQPQLQDLLAQGRLRPVLSHLQRTIGDPLALVVGAADPELVPGAEVLAKLPWRACFATAYAEVLRRIFAADGQEIEVLSHREVHRPTLRPQARDDERPMILKTPPAGRSMRADRSLFDLVEEVVRTRTILFLGFDVDDPDFAELLELLGRVGRGRRHFAWLGAVTEAEACDLRENFAVEVVDPGPCAAPIAALCALQAALWEAPPGPRSLRADLAALDLARTLATVPLRADVAADAALGVELGAVDRLVDELSQEAGEDWRLGLDPGALLRLGNVYLAHGRAAAASACHEAVRARGAGREYVALAGFNLSLGSAYAGRGPAAASGLRAAAAVDRSLSLVPSRLELAEVADGDPTRLILRCRDRESGERLELWVRTLAHPVGVGEQRRFHAEVRGAVALTHPGLWRVRGGFTDGQLFGVIAEPIAGESLATILRGGERMEVYRALRLTIAVLDALAALHAGGLVHRDVRPEQILVAHDPPASPVLAGQGLGPLIHVQRPALRRLADGYLAPERLAGEPATASSDLYAAAAVLYRCLTGRSPAGSVRPAGALVPGGLDPRIDAALAHALSPDPGLRISPRRLRAELAGVVSVPMLLVSRLGAAP